MSGALSIPLADKGPMQMMSAELQARIQAIFPPNYFGFAWMPAKADRAWFKRYVPRCPAVLLGWEGIAAAKNNGKVFAGVARFTLALVVKNSGSPQARYIGDDLGVGIFGMARAATVLLNGFLIDPPGNPFCANGTVEVAAIDNLYNDEWGDEETAVAALDLRVLYEETLPPGMEMDPAGPLVVGVQWNLGQLDPVAETIGPLT